MPNPSSVLTVPTDPASSPVAPCPAADPQGGAALVAGGEHTLADQLYRMLSDEITAGQLPPGSRLDESEVARRFGVSRTPVREALRQLGASGLVDARPRRGVVVATPSPVRLQQMFEVMADLEAICARLAAERMTARQRGDLERLHRDSAEAVHLGALERYELENRRFHRAIYDGTGNDFLIETILGVRARVGPFRRAQFQVVGRLGQSFDEHARVVTAILRGDGPGAAAAMRAHLAVVSEASERYLAGAGRRRRP